MPRFLLSELFHRGSLRTQTSTGSVRLEPEREFDVRGQYGGVALELGRELPRPLLDSNTSGAKARLLPLDALRFLAVFLVLGRHMAVPPVIEGWPPAFQRLLAMWERGGWVGVDLFFVLSGFLVSGLLFTEYQARGTISPARFYIRRGWKIYPPFYVLLGVTLLVSPFIGRPLTTPQTLAELLFVQNYLPGLWYHTWSLAVEEHFYILLPLLLTLLLALGRRSAAPLRGVLPTAAAVSIGTLGLRLFNAHFMPYSHSTHLFATHLRLDSLMFGVALSYFYHFHQYAFVRAFTRWRTVLMVAGAALLAPAFVMRLETSPFIYTVGLTLFQFGSGMLIVGALLSRAETVPFGLRMIAAIGAYSYSIYLWHNAVILDMLPILQHLTGVSLSYPTKLVLYLVGSVVFGVVMAKLVEMPALRLRDRLFPSQSRMLRPPVSERSELGEALEFDTRKL